MVQTALTRFPFYPAHAGGAFLLPCIRHGAGLLLCPYAIQPNTSVYSAFLYRQCNYTAHATKQRTGLHSGFSYDCTRSTVHDTSTTQADIMPPVPRWALHRSAQPSIIIRYIRGQTMPARRGQLLPCVDRWQVPHPAYLLRGQRLHLYRVNPAACDLAPGQPVALHPAGQSSSRGAAGGAEPLTATAAFLFGLSPDSQ